MKKHLFLLLLTPFFGCYCQEMDAELYLTLNSSTLHQFKNSDKSKMTVITYRHSEKHGLVEEIKTNYRKGRINTERINFNSRYTEFFVLEDRKKSLGKYDFEDGKIIRYERTDFDNKNLRKYTFYHTFIYEGDLIKRENIRTKEYIDQGSIELDTVVYRDSVIYNIAKTDSGYRQVDVQETNNYSSYEIKDDRLVSKTNHISGFSEKTTFIYDSKGHLIRIETVLSGEDNKTLSNRTELEYNFDGLVSEVRFYDEQEQLLEKKIFSYK
ncbi:MAG: hypothetical protein WDZ35_00630 [Crocinitomicaceae bacterium]